MTLRVATILAGGLMLIGSGCSLLLSTDDLQGDEPADAGGAEASALDGSNGVDASQEGGDAGYSLECPNGGGLLATSAWPMAGGCPNHAGRSKFVGPQSGDQMRSLYLAGGIAYAGPSFGGDGTVYYGTEETTKVLVAVSPSGGQPKWFGELVDNVSAIATVGADGTIYVGDGSSLTALDANGKQKFRYPTNAEMDVAPVVGPDGTIYFASSLGIVTALDKTGKLRWFFDTKAEIGFSNPALGADGTLYIGTSVGLLIALDSSGQQKWSYSAGGKLAAVTIGLDGTIYVGSSTGKLHAVTPAGIERWTYATSNAITASMPAIAADGSVIIASTDGTMRAVSMDGKERWIYVTGGPVRDEDPVIGADGTIYIGATNSEVHAVGADGKGKWKRTVPGKPFRQPAIGSDGRLYVGVLRSADNKGELYSIGP